jgi:hypothetical protein
MALQKRPTKSAPDYAQLEDRVMLSAAPIAAALLGAEAPVNIHDDGAAAIADQVAGSEQDSTSTLDVPTDHQDYRLESSDDVQQLRRELVVIDESA